MKPNIQALKSQIKQLVEKQITTKENRKTVNFRLDNRTLADWEATMKVPINRGVLREHYIAYAILRHKDPKDHLGSLALCDFKGVEGILSKYEEAVCVDS